MTPTNDEVLVVLDSSVWVSAFRFAGVPLEAVRQALREDRIVICEQIEAEVKRIMLSKFGSSVAATTKLLEALLVDAIRVTVPGKLTGICRDPKDDMLFECAAQGNAKLLVSGDNRVLDVRRYLDTEVLTPRQYVDRRRSLPI
jgi:putative PIN family toxin of toxin-antitoxin system